MDIEKIMAYCASKPGSQHLYKEEWQADLYRLRDKMFVMIGGDKEEVPIISLKCDPEEAVRLRERFKAVIPGYYLNKAQWNSIYYNDPQITEEMLREWIDASYRLVLEKLPKKYQAEIEG